MLSTRITKWLGTLLSSTLVLCSSSCIVQDGASIESIANHTLGLSPADMDGDGFASDIDCNDNDPSVRPLKPGTQNDISKTTTICSGTYNNTRLVISGNGISVSSTSWWVILPHGALALYNLTNSSVSNISVVDTGGFDIEPNGFHIDSAIQVHKSSNNTLSGLIADKVTSIAMLFSDARNNTVSGCVISNSQYGLVFFDTAGNNVVRCAFVSNRWDLVDQGMGNQISN